MKSNIFLLFILLFFAGCTTPIGPSDHKIIEAIELQKTAITDPLFSKILRELDAAGEIDWQEGSKNKIEEDISSFPTMIDWLFYKFENDGVYTKKEVSLWRNWNPLSSTNAATPPCIKRTKLNKWKMERDKYSWVNTLIHERIHSYCFIHPMDQTRETNKCDISYVSGDLAEIILIYRDGINTRTFEKPMCPELEKRISIHIN